MSIYFVDSSVIVKRYRLEAGSEHVSKLLDGADRLFMSRLGQVEVSAAITRRGRHTSLSTQELTAVLETLDRDVQESFDVVELDFAVIDRAIGLTRKHGLRAADAIQLSCALMARREIPQHEITFLASDRELNTAALAEGMSILDPAQG